MQAASSFRYTLVPRFFLADIEAWSCNQLFINFWSSFFHFPLNVFKEVAGYFDAKTEIPEGKTDDPSDMTKASNNPLLDEDLETI